MTAPASRKLSVRTLLPRLLNFFLWMSFCAMAGTGLLLAWRMPPGSRGGQGLEALGMGRHEWGDWLTWISYAFIAMILLHLVLHWRWFWQVAARKRPVPIVAGLLTGVVLMLALVLQPVHQRGGGHGGREGRDGGDRGGGREHVEHGD